MSESDALIQKAKESAVGWVEKQNPARRIRLYEAQAVGHKDVSPTMVYAHVLSEQRLTASANSVILQPHQRKKGDSICPR